MKIQKIIIPIFFGFICISCNTLHKTKGSSSNFNYYFKMPCGNEKYCKKLQEIEKKTLSNFCQIINKYDTVVFRKCYSLFTGSYICIIYLNNIGNTVDEAQFYQINATLFSSKGKKYNDWFSKKVSESIVRKYKMSNFIDSTLKLGKEDLEKFFINENKVLIEDGFFEFQFFVIIKKIHTNYIRINNFQFSQLSPPLAAPEPP